MDNKKRVNNHYIYLTLLAGFIYRLLISFQGIDHVDLGASNTFYQNIFTHPDVMPYSFNYYLTGLIGGVWYQWLGDTGVMGFRFLEALTLTAAIFFVFKAFERQLMNTHSAVLAIAMSFLFPSVAITFHYFTLTFFFLALAAWCYAKSLYDKPLLWTFLSGFILGLCFFVRTGNTALVWLILVPIVYTLSTHQRPLAVRLGGTMLGGMVTGCVLLLAVMTALGHLSLFWEGLEEAFAYYNEGETSYSFFNMIIVYFKDYVNIILQILAIIGLGALYIQSSRLNAKAGTILRIFRDYQKPSDNRRIFEYVSNGCNRDGLAHIFLDHGVLRVRGAGGYKPWRHVRTHRDIKGSRKERKVALLALAGDVVCLYANGRDERPRARVVHRVAHKVRPRAKEQVVQGARAGSNDKALPECIVVRRGNRTAVGKVRLAVVA